MGKWRTEEKRRDAIDTNEKKTVVGVGPSSQDYTVNVKSGVFLIISSSSSKSLALAPLALELAVMLWIAAVAFVGFIVF